VQKPRFEDLQRNATSMLVNVSESREKGFSR